MHIYLPIFVALLLSPVFGAPVLTAEYVQGVDGAKDSERDTPATAQHIADHDANRQIFEEGLAKANENLAKTKAVMENPTDKDNKKLIVSAFGQKAYGNDLDEIKANVNKIADANMRTRLPTQKKGDFKDRRTIGVTNWVHEDGEFKPNSLGFGKKFYDKSTSVDTRAGTIVHEAAHYAADAGDDVHPADHRIQKGHEEKEDGINYGSGYTASPELPKTIHEVAEDKDFTKLRGKSPNMKDNAESYAVLTNLCAHKTREYIPLARRALESRDYETAHAILRRAGESCGLTASHAQKQGIAQAAKEAAAVAKAKADNKATSPKVTTAGTPSAKHQENVVHAKSTPPKTATKMPAMKPVGHKLR
jgi:hypothetical protein